MKRRLFYLFLVLSLAQGMTAQLTSLGLVEESNAKARVTGYSNYIPEISFVGDYLYVGTPKGVYRNLYKSGAEWEKLSLTDELVLDFEVRGDTLIVLTCNQLLCSWDGGETVIQHPIASIIGEESSDVLQGMGVHPHDATHIFVGTNWSGLWRTRDGGSQWEVIQENGNYEFLDRIYFNPYDNNRLFGIYNNKYINYVSFHHSTDGGSHWSSVKGDYSEGIAEAYNVAFHPTNENRMVACGLNIYALSDDAGASWNAVRVPNPNRDSQYWPLVVNISDVVYDTRNPDILYGADWRAAGTGATTVRRSTDGGYTWEEFFSDTIASKGHVLSLDMKDNILALYTYGNGIYLLDVDAVETQEGKTYLVTEGKEWAVEYYTMAGVQGKSTYRLQGTTIINGKEYLIEHESNNDDLSDMHPSGRYMREENGKVYTYTSKDSSEVLYFDYTFIKGDTMRISSSSSICVEKVYYATMSNGNGQAHKCYEVSLWNDYGDIYELSHPYAGMYAEGIGHTSSGLSDPCLETVEANRSLLYVKQDGVMLYQPEPEPEKKYFFPANSIHCTNAITYMFNNDTVYCNLHTGNDTIVDGKSCVLLWCQGDDTPSLIHEEEGRVFINYDLYDGEWMLLYDFSLPEWHVGDKIHDPLHNYRSFPIDSVSTITLSNGEERQVAHYGDGIALIYGLGYIGEPFFEIYNRLYPEDGSYAHPISFYHNDELLWGYEKNEEPTTPKTYLVTEGKQWAVYHNNPLCSKHHSGTTTYRLQGETILYGKTYKKMWVSYKEDLSDMKPFNGYMREENGKVYFANSYEEKLWFDYTAQIGDTLCFKEGSEYGRINNIYEALLSETDSTRSYLCYEMQVGRYNSSKKEVEFVNQYINVYEGLGVIGRDMSYGLCEHYYQSSYDRQCSFTLLCVHNGENILYQTHEGCYKPYGEKPRPTTQRGYGIYYGDSCLYQYIIDESKEVTDSTDFARWHDKTVIYFDVDSVGRDAFANACFRQGQILYFTEKLRYIGQDAFDDILMLDEEPEAKNPFGDLCIVFSGENPPSIDENSIVNYADTTYRITYVVPDLATYIENDMQWTYSQLVTIDDFIAGYVSPENEVVVSDSVGVDLEVGVVDDGAENGITVVYATARPKKDIPVRIGDSNSGDIYSRAPAWMRYTVEIKVTDSKGGTLYTEKKQCSAYEECHFETTLTSFPEDGIVYVYSRSIDQYGNASDWTMQRIHLMSIDNIAVPESHSSYYDLTGRKVTHPTRGIYIKDGRKVIVHE